MAPTARAWKHLEGECPLALRSLDEDPTLQATRPHPRATSPTLIRHPVRSMHPESALLRMWLPHYPHAQGVSPTLSRSNQPHRRPPHEWPVESRAICARHHEPLAQENHPSFAQILADMLDIVVATQASAPAAISMEP